jgi:DNA-directed RNA polymerase I subunit RPA12
LTITTRSHPSAFPSALRQARQLVHTGKNNQEDDHEEATIKEMCPNCKSEEEMTFVNVQTRGADEGTSLFYTCTKCGHKFNQWV